MPPARVPERRARAGYDRGDSKPGRTRRRRARARQALPAEASRARRRPRRERPFRPRSRARGRATGTCLPWVSWRASQDGRGRAERGALARGGRRREGNPPRDEIDSVRDDRGIAQDGAVAKAARAHEPRAAPCARERKPARDGDIVIVGVVDDERRRADVGYRLRQLEIVPAPAEAAFELALQRTAQALGEAEAAREEARPALDRGRRRDENGADAPTRVVQPRGDRGRAERVPDRAGDARAFALEMAPGGRGSAH